MAFDLDRYRERAEGFSEELGREWYLHLSGQKPELEIERIYEAFSDLFERVAVERLRELATAAGGEDERRLRYLLHFALDGLLGRETRDEVAELARLEVSLEVETGGDRGAVPYRQVRIAQANEPDAGRRSRLEEVRNALLAERLNPLYLNALERSHELCRALGWPTYAAAYADVRGVDLEALALRTAAFLRATEEDYPGILGAELEREGLPGLGTLRRGDLPRLFHAPALDELFPAERLLPSFVATVQGLGIELGGQDNIHLDTERRPTKSARAFCATPRVPQEVHLVIAPTGGRDDYEALFHEGGHAEHYGLADSALAFEFRHLGDNAVTESFAFLLQSLTSNREWLDAQLGIADAGAALAHSRAGKLLMLRRYCAKLAYELELHGAAGGADLPGRYAALLEEATRVRWPHEPWLDDVDGGFYCACYLRAWALEAHWRRALRERFGGRWFESAEAGRWLRGLWREGQRLSAEELLGDALGEELDLALLGKELASPHGEA